MGNLIATCMKDKDKRTCGITRCSLAKCCGCTYSRISRKRYKPKFSTQYHIIPQLEMTRGQMKRLLYPSYYPTT